MVWVGRQLKDHPIPCHGQSSLLQAQSNLGKLCSADLTAMSIPVFSTLSLSLSQLFYMATTSWFLGAPGSPLGRAMGTTSTCATSSTRGGLCSAAAARNPTASTARYGALPALRASEHQNLLSAPRQSCSSCVRAPGKRGVLRKEIKQPRFFEVSKERRCSPS